MKYDLNELAIDIDHWGADKGILPNPDAMAQWTKTLEEVTELLIAIQTKDRDEAMDAIGDVFVTLVMQTDAWDCDISECVKKAYDVISKRTGKMVDGQFVKDSE